MTGSKLDRTCLGKTLEIPAASGRSFILKESQTLTITDPQGLQVSDLLAFNATDTGEVLSSGRTFDYNGKIFLSTGDTLYSNRSNALLQITADTVGRHDFLFTPCSRDTFRIRYGEPDSPRQGCFGNFAESLAPFGVEADRIPVPFNCFMNVSVDGDTGEIAVLPPKSKAGDYTRFEACMDLIVAVTACSAPRSNAGVLKPIHFRVE